MTKGSSNEIVASGQAIHSDVISSLPSDLIEAILMKLPTRDAVRTSKLSRKWRSSWTKLPQFIFDEAMWHQVRTYRHVRGAVTDILFQLFSSHQGPMKKFTLSVPGLESCPEIHRLIHYLYEHHVEDFTLEMWEDLYLLPSSIYICLQLRCLKLRSCKFATPTFFKGFSNLISLKLIKVTIRSEAFRHLISNSPLLEVLEISFLGSLIDLYIDASNLRSFTFQGFANSIIFKTGPLLASVSIMKYDSDGTIGFTGVEGNSVELLDRFPLLEYLQLNYRIVQKLAVVNRKLQTTLVHLKHLVFSSISFNEMAGVSFALCILRSSPNLKFVKIQFKDDDFSSDSKETSTFMELQDYSDIWLSQLTEVKLNSLTGRKPELELTRLLLAKSSSLKTLRIKPGRSVLDNGCKILKEVTKFRRLSKDAEVIYIE